MNPTSLESALKTWLTSAPTLASLTIHEATTAEEIPLDSQVIVAEVATIEQTLGPLYRATCSVTLRSPCLHIARGVHDATWHLLTDVLADTYRLEHQLNRALALAAAGYQFAGKSQIGGTITNTRDERSWLTTAEFTLGLRAL